MNANTPIPRIQAVPLGLHSTRRRELLRRAAWMAAAGTAGPWALNLAALGEAAAATATDYKALVCVFLYGGNDHMNTVVPYDSSSYALYQAARSTIATPRDQLLALSGRTGLPVGRQYALAPQMAGLAGLFEAGRAGIVLNVGPLIVPTTLAQYTARSVPLPPKLFSHNDQQSLWQSLLAEGATSGWGGRLGDLFLSSNSQATFTCINASGNAVFMSGQSAVQYVVSATGAVALNAAQGPVFGSQAVADALKSLTQSSRTHWFEAEHARVMKRAVDAQARLSSALAGVPTLATAFDGTNPLATQLQMVARLIAARASLGARRQVFFVSLGGFDTHDFLADQHPGLLTTLSGALRSFHDATVELGVADVVTAFTGSDFGRTLTSNGDGSDHGWGSHHLVVGGSVQGGRFWGVAPEVSTTAPDQVGQGRLLPSTSVDQLGAALARWFGVSAPELSLVFPNIGNFDSSTLPLFAA